MRAVWIGTLVGVLLAGCGGGGGSDRGDTPADPPMTPMEKALATGNGEGLDDQTLLEAALVEAGKLQQFQQDLVSGLGIEGALVYPVSRHSNFVNAAFGNGTTILRGSAEGASLASAVEFAGIRAAGIGFRFYQPASGAVGMDALGTGVIDWLAGGQVPEGIVTAGISDSALNNWLDAKYPQARQGCAELSPTCLEGKQVLIISDHGDDVALEALVESARQQGVSVFYIHTRGWGSSALGEALLAGFGMSLGAYPGNYFIEDALDWTGSSQMLAAMQQDNAIKTALSHFYHHDFPVNFADCDSLAEGDCDDYEVLNKALLDGASQLRNMLGNLDQQGRPLFEQPGQRLLKMLVLLGDLWRQNIDYPMKKNTAPQDDFLRALYADYSVHYLRDRQPAQVDMGSFSGPLNLVPTTSLARSLDVKGDHFTALGAYVLPGQKVSITRTDSSAAVTGIRLNTQRTGSTRLWSEYSRPRFLASPTLPIAPGETLEFTSPYGGTLQLVHRNASDTTTVSLSLKNVARQPFLQYGAAMDQAGFASDLQNSAINWTEIRSPFAEVHSRRDRMNQSINESRYAGNSQAFLDDLFEYVLRDAYVLAGFQGDGISLPDSVAQRCQSLGWDCANTVIHGLPKVLHINVDGFAHCGAGCSGNPYDQSWALDPYGWGESHELGHNLQRGRLNIHGGRSGEVSNNVFPLHKNWRLLQERDVDRSNDRIAYESTFNVLKNGAGSADPYQTAYDAIWANDSYAANNGMRMAFYIQLPHLWRDVQDSDDLGWDIVTLLYLAERQFGSISEADWPAQKVLFGMDNFASKPDLTGNEFMLIVSSFLSGRDLRPLWDQWGVDYGADTAAQMDALALPAQEAVVWVGPDSNDWSQVQKIHVAADMAWPF